MKNEFAEHLARVTHLPVNMPVFLQGYEEVLKGVAEAGRFRLHGLALPRRASPVSSGRGQRRKALPLKRFKVYT